MSHRYYLQCERCGRRTESGYNHGLEGLLAAVKASAPLHLLAQAGWQPLDGLVFDAPGAYLAGDAAALLTEHFGHGDFLVVSEYWRGEGDGRPQYAPVRVRPEPLAGVLPDALVLARAVEDARGAVRRIDEALARLGPLEAENARLRQALADVGRLTRWSGGGVRGRSPAQEDLIAIRAIAERETGQAFEEYT